MPEIEISTMRENMMNLVLNCRHILEFFCFHLLAILQQHQRTVSIATHSNYIFFNEGEK